MELRQKIILFAVAPMILALCAIAFTVYRQATLLEQLQRESMERAYKTSKDAELRNYSKLAEQAIAQLYKSGRKDEAAIKEAKAILAKLSYGADGYFFLFNLDGEVLMHPRQPELVGQNLWHMRDGNGDPAIQKLITRALAGGGFEDYMWQKPSNATAVPEPKRAYVTVLKNWNWVLGTGVYLDDVDAALAEVDKQAYDNIANTMTWIFVITILSLLTVISLGLVLNVREHRDTLEKERARVAAELHDDICQKLGALKLRIETGIMNLADQSKNWAIPDTLGEAPEELEEVVDEIRGIARNLYPESLADFGLEAVLRQLASSMEPLIAPIEFTAVGKTDDLFEDCGLALYRFAQEALTNIKRHADAQRIWMHLEGRNDYVMLTICDDGVGFDPGKHDKCSGGGIGLRNMKRRLEAVDGELTISSSPSGTKAVAAVPHTGRKKCLINLWLQK